MVPVGRGQGNRQAADLHRCLLRCAARSRGKPFVCSSRYPGPSMTRQATPRLHTVTGPPPIQGGAWHGEHRSTVSSTLRDATGDVRRPAWRTVVTPSRGESAVGGGDRAGGIRWCTWCSHHLQRVDARQDPRRGDAIGCRLSRPPVRDTACGSTDTGRAAARHRDERGRPHPEAALRMRGERPWVSCMPEPPCLIWTRCGGHGCSILARAGASSVQPSRGLAPATR